ncbi:Cna B-type domain-containing protein [Lapidilactobacillus wuchangensis]|uniref:Cna B-type domain-containing protein n=1 Tax=Lapidilactobacillus wuchangensis TaxID=2486001 RepID=UPI000F7838F1|nr:Cna B-type domain-containing protein [Lapidilactobacillus wuchangensis]
MSNGYKIRQRWIYMAVVLITVISQFLYLPASFVAAATSSGNPAPVSGLTSADAKDVNGQPLDTSNWTTENKDSVVYDWSIADGVPVNDGDYATLTLPNNVTFQEDYSFAITDNGTVVGNFTAKKGDQTGTLVFNDIFSKLNEGRNGQLKFSIAGTKTPDGTSGGSADTLLSKAGWGDPTSETKGVYKKVQWQLAVNSKQQTLSNVKIVDTIDTTIQTLDEDSISVTNQTTKEPLVEGTDYSISISGNVLTFQWLHDTLADNLNILYTTTITSDAYLNLGSPITLTNSAVLTGNKATPDGGQAVIVDSDNRNATGVVNLGASGSAGGNQGQTTIDGQKTWADNNNNDGKRPTEITVQLWGDKDGNGTDDLVDQQTVTASASGDANTWSYEFKDEPKYDSTKGKLIQYHVAEANLPAGYTSVADGMNLTNTYQDAVTTISGQKTWNDANNQDGKRPEKISVHLLADGTQVGTKTVTAADDWKYTFADQPVYHAGKEIKYTVSEDKVDDYTSTINGYDITNSYTPETTTVSGQKIWNDADNQDGQRPDQITVHLLADGQQVGTKVVTAQDNWQYSFTNLPLNKAGKAIAYTVAEDAVDGYTTSIAKGSNDITNTHTPATTAITGTKTWQDNNDQAHQRPESIIVNLVADGVTIASEKVTAKDNWQYSFDPLPVYQNGQKIVYTVTEDAVTNYQTEITGFDISNTYLPKTPNVPVTPTEPKQPQTITPQTPVLPTVPKNAKTVATNRVQAKTKPLATKQRALPQAGEVTNQLAVVLGVFLIILGGCTLLRRVEWSN